MPRICKVLTLLVLLIQFSAPLFSQSVFTPASFRYTARVDSVDSNIETTKYAIADLDNDGKIDVITIDRLNNTMSVYKNTAIAGQVSFAAKTDYTTGASPRSVSTGDIDGDGKQDIIVSNLTDNTVSVFRNTTTGGTISFAARVNFATASQPSAISVTDIDKDGKPDLVVNTIGFPGFVSVLRNTTTGSTVSFGVKTDTQVLGTSIEYLHTADIDGDGKPDILVPNYAGNNIAVFRNTSSAGLISFAAELDIPTGQYPVCVETGDLDNDGKTDMVVSYTLANNISVFRNTSSTGVLSFATQAAFSTGTMSAGISINDFDGDGKPDLAVCGNYDSSSLFKNTSPGIGTIAFQPPVKCIPLSADPIMSGDFDGDAKPDITVGGGIFRTEIWRNKATEPQIVSFTPAADTAGALITLNGVNFTGATAVSFGGIPAASFTVVSSTTIQAVVGNGASGIVSVTTPQGMDQTDGFTFYPRPSITSFTPTSGSNGTTISITGTNFINVSAVSFGGTNASSFTVNSPTNISAIVNNGSSGTVSITAAGGTATRQGFTYTGPGISSFSPAMGGVGTVVTIRGIGLSRTYAVNFGGVNATSYSIISDTEITAVVGSGASGNVKVYTFEGTASLSGFVHKTPIVSSFTPTSGAQAVSITIKGTNFTGTDSVSFGGTKAASFTVVNDTTIIAITGPGGTGDVAVSSSYGTGKRAGFVYTGPPIITSFAPMIAGPGATITITGFNFGSTTTVTMGGTAVLSFTVVNYNTIKAVTGTGSSGNVLVTTPYGNATLNGFTFFPAPKITSFSPASGPVGTNVTINGQYFSPVAVDNIVFFGAVKATVTAATSSTLTVTVPAGATYEHFSVTTNRLTAYSAQPFVTTFDNHGNILFGTGSFNSRTNIPLDYDLWDAGISDVDGDGRPDIAIANRGYLGMSVIQNTTTGSNLSFSTPKTFIGGDQTEGMFTKDLNGDGKPEIISGPDYFRNTSTPGNINFSHPPRLTFSNASIHCYAEDLDGDGRPEIVSANDDMESISVFRNASTTDTTMFEPQMDFPIVGFGRPFKISINDIDGDNRPDIIVSDNVKDGIAVFRNTSTLAAISLAAPLRFSGGKFPEGVGVGDLDGDGKPDVVTVSYTDANSTIYRNTSSIGAISFQIAPFNSNVGSPTSVALGDINGDGKLDMAITNYVGTTLFANTSTTGNISFSTGKGLSTGPNATNAAIGDLDGDGKPELVTQYSLNGSFVTVWHNTVGSLGILSFSPAKGTTGDTVRISGTGFTNVTGVDFGGTPAASFTVDSSKGITAVLGAGATGNVRVTTGAGVAAIPGFTYLYPPPKITNFTPTTGTTGTTVTITGNNFVNVTTVSFGGVPAKSFSVTSATSITATVDTGASGNVQVTTASGTTTLPGFTYVVPAPEIISFTPAAAATGAIVTITGNNFDGATAVSFGGVPAASYSVVSSTTITAVVGTGASGNISVTTAKGSGAAAGFTFITAVAPVDSTTKPLNIYPNPSNGRITVKHPASQHGILRFINIWGREVKRVTTAAGSVQTITNVRELAKGVYIVEWTDGTDKLTTTLLVE